MLVGLVAAVAVVSTVLAFIYRGTATTYPDWPYGMMGYGYVGMWIVMPLIAAVSVVLFVFFIYYLMEAIRPSNEVNMPSQQDPEEIAKLRLAKGEISQEEYERLIQAIHR
ncbi:hypothetical protein ApAK_06675 [Thermoplasmatales archaeon AK]|nr:hypothetical protein [Thermoplasmatales archaeon AK]